MVRPLECWVSPFFQGSTHIRPEHKQSSREHSAHWTVRELEAAGVTSRRQALQRNTHCKERKRCRVLKDGSSHHASSKGKEKYRNKSWLGCSLHLHQLLEQHQREAVLLSPATAAAGAQKGSKGWGHEPPWDRHSLTSAGLGPLGHTPPYCSMGTWTWKQTFHFHTEGETAILPLKHSVDKLNFKFCGQTQGNKDLNHTAIFMKVIIQKQKNMRNISSWLTMSNHLE